MSDKPRYLQRHEIDVEKWDECIARADNGLIYAHSWWLDTMSVYWSGLVWNDYEAVMPLTWKQKYGIRYLYQPWFTASLGMFCQTGAGISFDDFLQAIPGTFRYWDIDVNESNRILQLKDKKLQTRERINLIIDAGDYEMIRKNYSRLARRSLEKALQNNVTVSDNADITTIVQHYQQYYASQHAAIKDKDYQNLVKAAELTLQKGNTGVYTASLAGEIIGFYLVLQDDRYAYSLLGGTTPKGKETGAFYLLTDHAIRAVMEAGRSFRFEGSDIPGVAFFNRQFGPREIKYLHLKRNNLPFPLYLLKR